MTLAGREGAASIQQVDKTTSIKSLQPSSMRKDVGVWKEARLAPSLHLFGACARRSQTIHLCPTLLSMYPWSRTSGVMHGIAQVVLTLTGPAEVVCLSTL